MFVWIKLFKSCSVIDKFLYIHFTNFKAPYMLQYLPCKWSTVFPECGWLMSYDYSRPGFLCTRSTLPRLDKSFFMLLTTAYCLLQHLPIQSTVYYIIWKLNCLSCLLQPKSVLSMELYIRTRSNSLIFRNATLRGLPCRRFDWQRLL